MSKKDNIPVQDLLYSAAVTVLQQSDYAQSSKELQKVYIMGWLLAQLKTEYQHSYDLQRRIDRILHPD